jgi:hypothetical protein
VIETEDSMEIAYWIVAGLLAVFYLGGGVQKLVQSREKLAPMMAWVNDHPMSLVRTIGAIEVLGAIGLILPPLLDIAPVLAVIAAIGFAILQVLALGFHLRRGEAKGTPLNIVLIILAVVAAWLGTTFV